MFFPLILSALVITTGVFLVRQFWYGSLADDDAARPELLHPHRDDDLGDALKAA